MNRGEVLEILGGGAVVLWVIGALLEWWYL